MEFLKAHYEKLILGVLVAALVGVLVWLSSSIEQTSTIRAKDLQTYKSDPDHEIMDFSRSEFIPEQAFVGNSLWQQRSGVNTESQIYQSELVVPFKAARCSDPDCKKIVPLETMKKLHKCPYCGTELATPPEINEDEIDMDGPDSDQDGMPDTYELKMGFNAADPSDALRDADNDGFCNLYEMLMTTDPLNSKSYPGLDKRICLIKLRKTRLPYRLEGVTTDGGTDKHKWTIQIHDRQKRQNIFWEYGQEITLQKTKYKLADVQIVAASAMEAIDKDKVSIVLEPVDQPDGAKIIMNAGEDAYYPNPKAVIADIPTGAIHTLAVNGTFTVGDENSGKATFQLLAVDPVKETATLINQDTEAEVLLKLMDKMGSLTNPGMRTGAPGAMQNISGAPSEMRRAPARKQQNNKGMRTR